MALKKPSDLFGVQKVSEIVENINNIKEDLSEKTVEEEISSSLSSIDSAFKNIQEQIQQATKKQLEEYKEDILSLYTVVTNITENELPRYKKLVNTIDLRVESRITTLKKELYERLESHIIETKQTIQELYQSETDQIKRLANDISIVERYIANHSQDIVSLREEVFEELRKNPVNLDTVENKIQEVSKSYEVLTEGLLNEPLSNNGDPLSNQNFVTLDQLKDHYRLFLNRIQEQLATIGGGGETKLKYLDDIVGIATNASLYDGKFLKYDHTIGKFVFETVISGGGSGDYASVAGIATYAQTAGIATYASVAGISTYALKSGISTYAQTAGIATYASVAGISTYSLKSGISTYADVSGISTVSQGLTGSPNITVGVINASSASFTGNVSIAGTLTYEDVTNIDSLGIVTARSGVVVGPLTSIGATINSNGDASFSGIVTASSFVKTGGTSSQFLKADGSVDTSTYATQSYVGLSTVGLASVSYVNTQVGLATVGLASVSYVNTQVGLSTVGLLTATGSGINLTGIVTSIAAGSGISIDQSTGRVTITATGGGGGGETLDATLALGSSSSRGMSVGVVTATSLNVTGVSTLGISSASSSFVSGISTFAGITTVTGSTLFTRQLTVSGVSTFTGITTVSGSTLFSSQISVSGVSTFAGITTVSGSTLFTRQLSVTGVSTFVSGPIIVGSGTSTGTASQLLQVTGGAYVSGSVGVGTTNPRENLDVIGSIGVQASGATNRFEIVHNSSLNSLDFIFV